MATLGSETNQLSQTDYVYDQYDRLAARQFLDNLTTYNGGTGTPIETTSYTCDALGRQTQAGARVTSASARRHRSPTRACRADAAGWK